MAKVLCDFMFDRQAYLFTAEIGRDFAVRGLRPLANDGLPRAADVYEQCVLIDGLIRLGLDFGVLESVVRLGPLTLSIVAAVSRARVKYARTLAPQTPTAAETQMIEGYPL